MATTSIFLISLLLLIVVTLAQIAYKPGNCPMRNTVTTCTPRCMSDNQCHFNEKCCPNKCGYTSCARPSSINFGDDGGYKGSFKEEAVYCAGVKCGPYEKCRFDRNTKREKCVRT